MKAGATGKLTVSFLPFEARFCAAAALVGLAVLGLRAVAEAPAHFTALLGVFDSKAGTGRVQGDSIS